MQVRRDRPVRELTCDDCGRALARQEALLGNLLQKLQRGAGLVAVDIGKLQDVRQRLATALNDKVGRCQCIKLFAHTNMCPGCSCFVARGPPLSSRQGYMCCVAS